MWRSRHKVTENFDEKQGTVCHGKFGESDTGAELHEEHQASLTLKEDRHLTEDLMTKICSKIYLLCIFAIIKHPK